MSYAAAVIADSPLVYWRLGEVSGTAAADASGNGHTGTYFGSPTLGVTGLLTADANKAAEFDGTLGQRVDGDDTPVAVGTLPAFSIEAVFDIPATGEGQITSVANQVGIAPDLIELLYVDGDVLFDFQGTSGYSPSATSAATGVHHLVGVFNGSTVKLYIDGVEADSQSFVDAGAVQTVANAFAGANYPGGTTNVAAVGVLDEIAFYTTALSAVRVAAHYDQFLTPTGADPPTVTAVSPNEGINIGGNTVVLTGTNFTGATSVKFGSVNATSFVVDSDTQITAVTPAHVNGLYHAFVTTPDGTSGAATGNEYTFASVDPDPPAPDPVVIRVIELDGTSHTSSGLTDGQLPFARAEQITRTRNEPSDAVIPFPKYAYTRDDVHIFADDSGTGDLHLIEVVRNGIVRFRGFAIVADGGSGNGEITLHCKGIDWALGARFLDGQRTNELTNPSFETGDETGWTTNGAATSTVTTDDAVRGTHSLRLESITPLGDIFEEQTVSITGTGVGTFITVVFYFKLESIGGHAFDRRGLYVEGVDSGIVQANYYYPIDEATPTGEWIRAKATVQVPPLTTWDINVRLYSPPGSILWDDGQMVAMQSISTVSITGNTFEAVDVSEIVALVLAHAQNPAVGKSDLLLELDNPTVGVTQVKHIQWADHISWPDQMSEWLDRDDCFDYSVVNDLDGTNTLTLHVPVQGIDRRADVTLQFPDPNVPPIVASFDLTEDGGSTITDDTELDDDTGDGPDREEGHYADASQVGGLTLQTVTAAPTKSEPSSLDPLAREKVKKARRPAQLLTITLNGAEEIDGTPVDELLGIGDVVTLALDDGWIQVDGFGRISQIVEFPKDRRLEVTIPVAVP